jgi:DNA polymerase (family X)
MAERSNQDVAYGLKEIARYKALAGGSAWGLRAYVAAADTVTALPYKVAGLSEGSLRKIPGVGASLAATIRTLAQGELPDGLTAARAQWPRSVFTLTRIVGIGDKRAIKLYEKYGHASFSEMLLAVQQGQIDDQKLCAAVRHANKMAPRMPWEQANKAVTAIMQRLSRGRRMRLRCVGSYRRRAKTVGDLDFLFASEYASRRAAVIRRFRGLGAPIVSGEHKNSVYWTLTSGRFVRVDMLVVKPSEWGAALCYFTGNEAHNRAMRTRANTFGWTLNEYGLLEGQSTVARTERGIYNALGVVPTPPRHRDAKLRIR